MLERLSVSTPSRLHFGLFSVGHEASLRFGGVGLMIGEPRVRLSFFRSPALQVEGPESQVCRSSLESCFRELQFELAQICKVTCVEDLPFRIQVEAIPTRHAGFGTGTQLALATAVGAFRMADVPMPSPVELAAMLGRGKRSAIGTYGFFRGGLIVDRGKSTGEELSPLDYQAAFPANWTITTLVIKSRNGMAGTAESSAFTSLKPTTEAKRQAMIALTRETLLPAVQQNDYARFGEALYEFGYNSGLMFADVQGGAYNGTDVANLVREVRELGIPAVGQSSWGPCVFAVTCNDEATDELVGMVQQRYADGVEVCVTKADNTGAVLTDSKDELLSVFEKKKDADLRSQH